MIHGCCWRRTFTKLLFSKLESQIDHLGLSLFYSSCRFDWCRGPFTHSLLLY
nr:MAG TPA: hypothetical protein [Caudoviricetes sp.]